MIGAPVGLVLCGAARHDKRAKGTGTLSAEALIDAEVVDVVLKYSFMRRRPMDGGAWFKPNKDPSFPSAHSIGIWAVASTIASEYRGRPVAVGAYAAAGAVAVSRWGAHRHHWSDIVVGSAMGWLIGHYVARHHPIR